VTRRSSGDLTPVGADGRNDRVIDLTSYPCLCIDAQRTRFRDDALGLRPREATGRSVVPGASKWEVLVHVVDVSDIYSVSSHKRLGEDERNRLALLKDASRTRGTSRYDLPLGPLHLLPPRVLESLSFSSKSPGHRCVTLWAYIDERCGKLIDCGLERTLVRPPRILSFSEASELTSQSAKAPESDANLRSMLLVLERILTSWSQLRRKNEDAARKREERLSMRELAGRMDHKQASLAVDDGRHGFQRSRGHRLVDSALDLYSAGVSTLIRKAKEPIPQAKGADCSRGGRVATAPLRRYIDGEAQRQALAVILDQGPRISAAECKEIGKVANEARNSIATIRAARNV
jgi:exoribonuclease R